MTGDYAYLSRPLAPRSATIYPRRAAKPPPVQINRRLPTELEGALHSLYGD